MSDYHDLGPGPEAHETVGAALAVHTYTTEDGVELKTGDRAYNYYDMKPGRIGRDAGSLPDPWFDFDHDDGTVSMLNGQRICSLEYAVRRGFKNAARS